MDASIKLTIAFIWALTKTFLKLRLVADSPMASATTLFEEGSICLKNVDKIFHKDICEWINHYSLNNIKN